MEVRKKEYAQSETQPIDERSVRSEGRLSGKGSVDRLRKPDKRIKNDDSE